MLNSSIIYIWPGSYEVSGSASQQPQILQNVVVSVSTKKLISKILPVLLLINETDPVIKSFHTRSLSNRSNCLKVFCTKSVLKNFAKFTGKQSCKGLFFNKVAGLPATLLKKRFLRRCFPENVAKFFKTPYRTPPAAVSVLTPKKHVFSGYRKKPLRSSQQRCFIKKAFLKTSQNSQENTCARISFY